MNPIEIFLGVAFPLLVGVALALAMGSGGTIEFLIAKVASVAAALDIFGLTTWWLYRSNFSFEKTVLGAVIGIFLIIALPQVLRWIDSKEVMVTQKPDIALRFVYPESPALVLINNSKVIAKDIKWTVALWNMDLPDRNDPLPIPVSTFDWIKPQSEGGPQNLFGSELVAPLLKSGDKLFGSASVSCPECVRGRTYIVYIVWGQGGWFAEVENEKSGSVIVPPNFLKESRLAYFEILPKVISDQMKVPIGPK